MKKINFIGSIELGNTIYVSDPDYPINAYGQVKLVNILPGKYNCYVEELSDNWCTMIAALCIFHENYQIQPTKEYGIIGVDTAKAGFFDGEYFENTRNDVDWHQEISNFTSLKINKNYNSSNKLEKVHLNKENLTPLELLYHNFNMMCIQSGEVLDGKCCICDSGEGDGGYPLYIGENEKKKIISAKIHFLDDEMFNDTED